MATRHSFLSTTGLIRSPSSTSSIRSFATLGRNTRDNTESGSSGSSSKMAHSKKIKKLNLPANLTVRRTPGVIPLGPLFIIGMAITISLFFIVAISFAFIGAEDEPVFRGLLNELAEKNPGIVLIGDNVDVDIDEPAVTIRWSILACGQNYTLQGSEGTHGSSSCGIPNIPLDIYVDGDPNPTATYNPDLIPVTSGKSSRLGIQNLYQFDSDHVLDVHEARLYPFDTYHLTSTIRVTIANTSSSLEITRLPTLTDTSSFIISSTDYAGTISIASSTGTAIQSPSRDLDLNIQRPGEARFFALMLFGVNWMLAHSTVGFVVLACKSTGSSKVALYLALCVTVLLVIPQIRNTMPDAPGYDGVLVDQIGLFSQMLTAGISTIFLLATLAKRELAALDIIIGSSPSEESKATSSAMKESLHRLKASVDFRHMRSLSKKFLTRLEPPSPIAEYPDTTSLLDPFAADDRFGVKGKTPQTRVGVGKSASSRVVYSEWV